MWSIIWTYEKINLSTFQRRTVDFKVKCTIVEDLQYTIEDYLHLVWRLWTIWLQLVQYLQLFNCFFDYELESQDS